MKYCICNAPSPPLADIVLFNFSFRAFPHSFKMKRFPRPYKDVSFSSLTKVGYDSIIFLFMNIIEFINMFYVRNCLLNSCKIFNLFLLRLPDIPLIKIFYIMESTQIPTNEN